MLAIDSPFTDPYLNLAAEEYLLKEWRDDIFFLYTDEPSVIVVNIRLPSPKSITSLPEKTISSLHEGFQRVLFFMTRKPQFHFYTERSRRSAGSVPGMH
jgi:hypothetical protein